MFLFEPEKRGWAKSWEAPLATLSLVLIFIFLDPVFCVQIHQKKGGVKSDGETIWGGMEVDIKKH